MRETAEAADRRSEEAARRFVEIDRKLQENAQQMRETNRRFQKTQRLIRKSFLKTDRKIRELTDLFTNQWEKLIEALVEPGCMKLFQERDINVKKSRRCLGRALYGAVAGMLIEEGVSEFAYRQGLFVLGLGTEGLARMLNDKKFKPIIFNEIA